MLKRIAVAAAIGSVAIFVMAGLAFGLVFADFFASHFPAEFADVNRADVTYPLIYVSDLLYAVMLAYVLESAGVKTPGRGVAFGAFIGFTVVLHFDLIWTATTYLTTARTVAANVGISTVMSGVAGAVIATVLGRMKR